MKWQFIIFFILLARLTYGQQVVFKDGDRVCFIGNSITMAGGFSGDISLFYATRYPERHINFYNCGIAGNVTQDILDRMDKDILIHKPTWGIVMSGMNDAVDSLYSETSDKDPTILRKRRQNLDTYVNNLDKIITELQATKCKVILETPTIFDQNPVLRAGNTLHKNEALKLYATQVKLLAEKYNLLLIDYWTILSRVNSEAQNSNPNATIIGPDRVHPGTYGHFVMFYQFLKTTQPLPYVSKLRINLQNRKCSCLGCKISNLRVGKASVKYISLENALPMPLIFKDSLVTFNSELNQESIQIQGINEGKYSLKIDGTYIATYTAEELLHGVNISQAKATPQYKQSALLANLFKEYWRIEQILRGMKYLEYTFLTSINDMKDSEAVQKVFDQTMEGYKVNPKPWSNYIKTLFEEYLQNILKVEEYQAKLIQLHNTIIASNKPVEHIYTILRNL